jgi:hypothetical protein
VKRCFAIQAAQKLRHYSHGSQNIGTSRIRGAPLSEGKTSLQHKIWNECHPIIGFLKYDDSFNPQSAFAAILTCSQADGACPFIAGAEKRIPITFEDQKHLIIHHQQEKYKERASNRYGLFYVFSQIKNNMSATNCTPALNRKKLGFDSYLTLWIFLAMAIGLPLETSSLPAAISSTPFPVELLIFLWQLVYPDDVSTISKVKYEQMGQI